MSEGKNINETKKERARMDSKELKRIDEEIIEGLNKIELGIANMGSFSPSSIIATYHNTQGHAIGILDKMMVSPNLIKRHYDRFCAVIRDLNDSCTEKDIPYHKVKMKPEHMRAWCAFNKKIVEYGIEFEEV